MMTMVMMMILVDMMMILVDMMMILVDMVMVAIIVTVISHCYRDSAIESTRHERWNKQYKQLLRQDVNTLLYSVVYDIKVLL